MSKTDELVQKLIKNLDTPYLVVPDDIPNIDLYMDQVTTFMNKFLSGCKRTPEDKILTKTMINNYAKNDLLPSPDKKKYSKKHLIILIFIYYLKGFLSISDIQSLIKPLTDNHYNIESEVSLEKIYETIFSLENKRINDWKKELAELNELSKTVFEDENDEDILQSFSLICLLSFDVYMRKKAIETMIDELIKPLNESEEENKNKSDKKEKKVKKVKKDSPDKETEGNR